MNELLNNYMIDVRHPGVSGIEHLQMLQNRTRLATIETALSGQERQQLAAADRALIAQAHVFLEELSRFVDLAEERRRLQITPNQWWWYLDVFAGLPDYILEHLEEVAVVA
jgi:hypothetical protein